MHNIWFKKAGWLYRPVHPVGLAFTVICLLINIVFYIAIDRDSNSPADSVMNLFVYSTCIFFWWKWVAEKTS
jgi:hypothetical protein